MSEKEKEIWVQKITRIIIATISLIVLVISLWIMSDCFKKPQDQKKFIMNYNSKANVDYKVYLKSNKFYDQQYLGKNKKYVASLIDYINVDFGYIFSSSQKLDATYSYTVNAVVSSDYELNGKSAELWSKSYTVIPAKSDSATDSANFNIRDSIKIDYKQYDSIAKKFKEQYGVISDTKLTILIDINLNSSLKGDYKKKISDTKNIKIVLPLNKTVTDVNVSGDKSTNNDIFQTIKVERNINYTLLIISIVLSVISLPICGISFYKLFKITNVSQYVVTLNKILKGYGDIIAEVTTKPDLTGLNIIEVKKFEDLINIEEELRVPILYYELEKDSESWFVITTGNQVYRYILRASSLGL